MPQELRFYSLCNFYLSSIQQGIQSGHALGEIIDKYVTRIDREVGLFKGQKENYDTIKRFLQYHKTWVVLNGGAHNDIKEFRDFLTSNEDALFFKVPFSAFYEDQESLGGIITCVGLIIPEEYFNVVSAIDVGLGNNDYLYIVEDKIIHHWKVGTPDWELINRIKGCRLAQ